MPDELPGARDVCTPRNFLAAGKYFFAHAVPDYADAPLERLAVAFVPRRMQTPSVALTANFSFLRSPARWHAGEGPDGFLRLKRRRVGAGDCHKTLVVNKFLTSPD